MGTKGRRAGTCFDQHSPDLVLGSSLFSPHESFHLVSFEGRRVLTCRTESLSLSPMIDDDAGAGDGDGLRLTGGERERRQGKLERSGRLEARLPHRRGRDPARRDQNPRDGIVMLGSRPSVARDRRQGRETLAETTRRGPPFPPSFTLLFLPSSSR